MTDEPALSPLEQACKNVGGASALGRLLKITPQAVLQWPRVPAERVLEVETHTGISRHDLRPDIFGPAQEHAA